MKDLKERVVRGGMARLFGQAANLVLRLGFTAIMARLLDPRDFGLVAMVSVITGIYGLFSTAGLSLATIQRPTVTNEQISTLFWINILVGVILFLLCLATAPALVSFYHEPRLFWVTVMLGLGFILSAGSVQHSALLQRQLRHFPLAMTETLSLFVGFALGIAMALQGYEYWALVASAITAPAINTACIWAIAAWTPERPRRGGGVGAMLRFGGTITLNNLVVYFAYNLDKLLLGRFWGADALGLYGRAYQLINIPNANLLSAVGTVLFSALSRLHDDPVRLRNYFLKSYALVASITVPVSIFCATFADDIVLIVLGPKWIDAASMFRLLTPTILVFGIINPTGWLIQSVGLHTRSLAIAFAIAPLTITAYLVGLPYGPNGVALAFSVSMVLWVVPHVFWAVHNTVITAWDIFILTCRPFLASIAAAAFALGIQFYLINVAHVHSSVVKLLIAGGAMIIIYLLLFLFVMGQKAFYIDLLRVLKDSVLSTRNPGQGRFSK